MSQDRILGSSASLRIVGPNGPQHFAELDSFTAKDKTEMKMWRPLGQVQPHAQLVYGGYDLSFKGAKVNDDWDQIQKGNDIALLNGNAAPRYQIVETTQWFNGNVETWIYDNVILHGLNIDKATGGDEIKMDIQGYAPTRTNGEFNSNLGVLSTI